MHHRSACLRVVAAHRQAHPDTAAMFQALLNHFLFKQ